jgi:hypothetical protein
VLHILTLQLCVAKYLKGLMHESDDSLTKPRLLHIYMIIFSILFQIKQVFSLIALFRRILVKSECFKLVAERLNKLKSVDDQMELIGVEKREIFHGHESSRAVLDIMNLSWVTLLDVSLGISLGICILINASSLSSNFIDVIFVRIGYFVFEHLEENGNVF